MKSRRIRYLLAALVLILGGMALYAFVVVRPLPVEVVQPEENVAVRVFGLGTVEARILSKVGFEVGGALVDLKADHGDWVRKGSVLASLHRAEQEARLAKANATVLQAEAALKKSHATATKARAILTQRRVTNLRRQSLVRSSTISKEVAEDTQTAEDVAMADLSLTRSDVKVAEAAIANARAQQKMEAVLLDHHILRAPYKALVVARHKELGAVLSPGEPLFTLIDPRTVWVKAHVDESTAGGVKEGQSAQVRLRSLPRQTFPAKVVRIDIESDRVSEERRVYVKCEQCPERFYLGEQAEVHIMTGRLKKAFFVPERAVEGFDGTFGTVWTVEAGHLNKRKVGFGQRTLDGRLEVNSGLPQSAQIVRILRPGLRVGRKALVLERAKP